MKKFINDDFLLETTEASQLYHQYAKDMPIIDYHCHLIPSEVAEDRTWDNLSQIWLAGDHYKWRAMRTAGVNEKFCTGEESDYDKFLAFSKTLPKALRNPLYHWSHLELSRYFDVETLLNEETAEEVWNQANSKLQNGLLARTIMKNSNVKVVCTTDDPVDSLLHHKAVAADSSFEIQMRPTWRPDKALFVEELENWNLYIDTLAAVSEMSIRDYDDFLAALKKRHDFFHDNGCRLSDYGIETAYAAEFTMPEIHQIFNALRQGQTATAEEDLKFKSALMLEFAKLDHASGWVMQLHFGALRNNSQRMLKEIGKDSGFDSIGDWNHAAPLSRFLDRLDSTDQLPKTILYNLNPSDNEVMATMIGNFQDGSCAGKIQFGSGWWFLDQKDGMERQLEALSQLGLLSCFIGMLTDSRSFLSYTRHEYFRRILCNILGKDMQKGLVPYDFDMVGGMIQDICYNNAAKYFDFGLDTHS